MLKSTRYQNWPYLLVPALIVRDSSLHAIVFLIFNQNVITCSVSETTSHFAWHRHEQRGEKSQTCFRYSLLLAAATVWNTEMAGRCIFSCFLPKTLFPIPIPKLPWLCACWLELFRFEEGRISVRLQFSFEAFHSWMLPQFDHKMEFAGIFQVSGFSKKICWKYCCLLLYF